MDTTQVAIRDLETTEATQFVADGEQPRFKLGVRNCLLRLARTSTPIPWLAQPTEPPDADPHVLVVWDGRTGDCPPYPDCCSIQVQPHFVCRHKYKTLVQRTAFVAGMKTDIGELMFATPGDHR